MKKATYRVLVRCCLPYKPPEQLQLALVQSLYWNDDHRSSKRYSLSGCFDDEVGKYCLALPCKMSHWCLIGLTSRDCEGNSV